MRFLILADIHANRHGLEAGLADAHGHYEQLLCLGDIVVYGAYPNECCELLRLNEAQCLSGNHDAATVGLIDVECFTAVARAAVLWTREHLSGDNRAWLESLPANAEWPDYSFQAVHASLREPWEEYITGVHSARPTLAVMKQPVCFFGHTHIATCFSNLDRPGRSYALKEAMFAQGGEVCPEPQWKYLINPGSCGQPRDGNPQARYALFDTATRRVEIRAVDYEWELARAAIYDAGLPRVLGDRLLRGR
jgi:predicted phosphodiesterase